MSPLERLRADKNAIRIQCKENEIKLTENFTFIQANARLLIGEGILSLFWKSDREDRFSKEKLGVNTSLLSKFSGAPLFVWQIIKPILLSWGVRKSKSWLLSKLFRKKKKRA